MGPLKRGRESSSLLHETLGLKGGCEGAPEGRGGAQARGSAGGLGEAWAPRAADEARASGYQPGVSLAFLESPELSPARDQTPHTPASPSGSSTCHLQPAHPGARPATCRSPVHPDIHPAPPIRAWSTQHPSSTTRRSPVPPPTRPATRWSPVHPTPVQSTRTPGQHLPPPAPSTRPPIQHDPPGPHTSGVLSLPDSRLLLPSGSRGPNHGGHPSSRARTEQAPAAARAPPRGEHPHKHLTPTPHRPCRPGPLAGGTPPISRPTWQLAVAPAPRAWLWQLSGG